MPHEDGTFYPGKNLVARVVVREKIRIVDDSLWCSFFGPFYCWAFSIGDPGFFGSAVVADETLINDDNFSKPCLLVSLQFKYTFLWVSLPYLPTSLLPLQCLILKDHRECTVSVWDTIVGAQNHH